MDPSPQIMKGAAFVVDELQRGVAVLVHCSDGWDRTAQLTALAQVRAWAFFFFFLTVSPGPQQLGANT